MSSKIWRNDRHSFRYV